MNWTKICSHHTKKYFEELISTGMIKEVIPSEIWYEGRTDFGINRVGTPLKYHSDYGFELLQGNSVFSGEILGGCIDSIYDFFNGKRYVDMPLFCRSTNYSQRLQIGSERFFC